MEKRESWESITTCRTIQTTAITNPVALVSYRNSLIFILHVCVAFPCQSLYSAVSFTDIVHFNDWVSKRADTGRTVNCEAKLVGGNAQAHSKLDMLVEKQALLLCGILPQDPERAAFTKA